MSSVSGPAESLVLSPREISGLARFYDTSPTKRLFQTYRPYICPLEAVVAAVPKGAAVLDIGCGSGLTLLSLIASGWIGAATAFDPDASALRALQAAVGKIPGARVEIASDLESLEPRRFGAVMMIDVLHHVPPSAQKSMVEAAARLVAPGGVLIYKDMARRPFWKAAANQLHDLILARQWINHRDASEVGRWLDGAGLRPEQSARFDRLWYAHEMLVYRA